MSFRDFDDAAKLLLDNEDNFDFLKECYYAESIMHKIRYSPNPSITNIVYGVAEGLENCESLMTIAFKFRISLAFVWIIQDFLIKALEEE